MAEEEQTTLRQKVLAVLTQRGEALSYRDLTDVLWSAYPQYKAYFIGHYSGNEKKARQELRIQLGNLVKSSPGVFTATKTEGVVLVGLAATEADSAEEFDDEAEDVEARAAPAVYWYTFPAYKRDDGPYPIKIGRGNNPLIRISHQVTAMPEPPELLGTYEHSDVVSLERALHAVLNLRGKRKRDAPGAEWFITTPSEVKTLIELVLGSSIAD
ncbi:GIY-YIG nuclease family protein [Variovorax sp. S2]|uniref:GIY-YIG nuclease family protein n=1 Tax=Variovorax sp. S12S4 TaxID=3029170 RepID=UPI00215B9872|nr:GIY-YIG nuclease family protein [Variovorax sp. S12S4]MCR8959759.1 GIY-YIG nuclease family protein [Variovorax sp. S12S4]